MVMAKERETSDMLELYRNGVTCKEIGDLYGISQQAVWLRFERRGLTNNYYRSRPEEIDGERLKNLYEIERLAIKQIASAFDVSLEVIKKALKLHKIPVRKALRLSGKHIDLLEKLNLGNQVNVQLFNKYPEGVLRNAARKLGIKISLRSLGGGRFMVTRIDNIDYYGLLTYQRIDKNRLKEMYMDEKLPIAKIGTAFGCNESIITEALKYNAIPRRPPLKFGGTRVDMLRNLAVGEQTEINCDLKYPVTNLHTIAKRIGLKISVRSLGDGRFKIKRI